MAAKLMFQNKNWSSHKVAAKLYICSIWHYIEGISIFIFEVMTSKNVFFRHCCSHVTV